jgi:hypothetical protein
LDGGRGWNAVERHVDEQRISTCGARACGSAKAFPLSSTGLVDVHVGIDQAGKYSEIFEIESLGCGRYFVARNHVYDSVVIDEQSKRASGCGKNDSIRRESTQRHGSNFRVRKYDIQGGIRVQQAEKLRTTRRDESDVPMPF